MTFTFFYSLPQFIATNRSKPWHGIVQCEPVTHMIEALHIKSGSVAIQQALNDIKVNHRIHSYPYGNISIPNTIYH